MKILFLIDNLRPGGAQKALLEIVRKLRNKGADPRVWCLGGSSEIENGFQELGVPVLGKPASLVRLAAEPFALCKYLKKERIEVLQTLLFHSDVAGRMAGRLVRFFNGKSGRPIIISSVRASNVRNKRWQFWLERMTAPLADAFTAVSAKTLDFAVEMEGMRREQTSVIANGIDADEWKSLPDRIAARREFGAHEDAFVVSTVGRLHPQKGFEYLIEAATKVKKEVGGAVFLIAGYGPSREKLEEQVKKAGAESYVQFLGYRRDVRSILAASDVFALPSLWEGMSNAILEAMAAGKPVVATEVDGALDQVVNGETGLLVGPADSNGLADAIITLAKDPQIARQMGIKGRERAREKFSLDEMTEKYYELYARLLAERVTAETTNV